jgi:predicted Zn finger-like uncharacterized protein
MWTAVCPQCQTLLRVAETLAGRQVRCPCCHQIFLAPANGSAADSSAAPLPTEPAALPQHSEPGRPARRYWDEEDEEFNEDDRDYPRRRLPRQDTSAPLGFGVAALTLGLLALFFAFIPVCGAAVAVPIGILGMILAIVALALAVARRCHLGLSISSLVVNVLAILIALAWLLFLTRALQEAQPQVAPAIPQGPLGPPPPGPPPLVPQLPPLPNARTILQRHERLGLLDPPSRLGHPSKTFSVHLTAGKTYQIDLESGDFDAYLILEDDHRFPVAEDDDSGGNLNSRILYLCPRTGDYQIICTSFNERTGSFTLTVREGQ